MLLLDLYCGAGGASVGYQRAGFDVVGVDIAPQKNYPFEFHQDDALEFLTRAFLNGTTEWGAVDAIHASPPCQVWSSMSNCRPGLAGTYPSLIDPTRELLIRTGLPWVMENVDGSGLPGQSTLDGAHGVTLCGLMFGLELYRHRLFESSFPIVEPHHPRHLTPASRAGHWEPGTIMSVAGNCYPASVAREAMGIDWMTIKELSESIPPAYTRHIGIQLFAELHTRRYA